MRARALLFLPTVLTVGCRLSESQESREIRRLQYEIGTLETRILLLNRKLEELQGHPCNRLASALQLERQGRYTEASECYRLLVADYPGSPEAVRARERIEEISEKARRQRERDMGLSRPPVVIKEARITKSLGGDLFEGAWLELTLQNTSGADIDAVTVSIECFNRFDDPVPGYGVGSHVVSRTCRKRIHEGRAQDFTWILVGHETTTKARVRIERVQWADGDEWEPAASEDLARTAQYLE